jgi:hypothetical protein
VKFPRVWSPFGSMTLGGNRKRAVIDWYREPYNPELRREFLRWVEVRYGVSAWRYVLSNRLSSAATIPIAVKDRVLRYFGRSESRTLPRILGRDLRPEQWLFIWAANRLADMDEAAIAGSS